VAGAHSPLHAVIAHSFGNLAALHAVSQGLAPRRMVAVSPPSNVECLLNSFAAGLGISAPVMAVHRRLLEARFGPDLWERFSPAAIAPALKLPALLVHDDEDHDVPWQEGAALARAWPGAELFRTHGLGHRRILHNPEVVRRVCEFVTAGEGSPPH
jgi:pimeloyl-ACP methyl ester carboxylesterase